MRFGANFQQTSVPRWAACELHFRGIDSRQLLTDWPVDNVDYDDLKHLIKANTTRHSGQAITVPGQVDLRQEKFELDFYKELREQHDRVNLFIKSKNDEYERRLRECPSVIVSAITF
jgi:SPX domain protein involved in polyphosphate accumulation